MSCGLQNQCEKADFFWNYEKFLNWCQTITVIQSRLKHESGNFFHSRIFQTNALINIWTVLKEPLPRVQRTSVSTTFRDIEVRCGPSTSKISAIFSDMSVSVSASKSTENSGPGGFPSIVRVPQFLPTRRPGFGPISIGPGRQRSMDFWMNEMTLLTGQKVLKFLEKAENV